MIQAPMAGCSQVRTVPYEGASRFAPGCAVRHHQGWATIGSHNPDAVLHGHYEHAAGDT